MVQVFQVLIEFRETSFRPFYLIVHVVKRQTAVWEVEGPNLIPDQLSGMCCLCYDVWKWLVILVFSEEDENLSLKERTHFMQRILPKTLYY